METTRTLVPMFVAGHALKSFRDAGYTLPAALAELIDNSIEANANNIILRLDEGQNQKGKKHIHRIVVIDDGEGMDNDVLHQYLRLGFSTRYMRRDTIGKYGVGATLAALNFANRIEVWSRTSDEATWQHVYFDLGEAMKREENDLPVGIEAPVATPVPEDIRPLLPSGAGTVVIWSQVDRLEEGRRAPNADALRVEVEQELSRIFRYFLAGGIKITINSTKLLPHDPLYLLEGTWADKILREHADRLAKGADTDEKKQPSAGRKTHFPAERIAQERIPLGKGTVTLTVTLYPTEVTRRRGLGGDELARRLRVSENEGVISFVRHEREINYTNVPRLFPLGVENRDRFIGIEVAFMPDLDEYFGVRNVKRGVEPDDELRTTIRKLLDKYIREAREKLEERWGQVAQTSEEHHGEHSSIVEAVKNANRTLPKSRVKDTVEDEEQQQLFKDLAEDVVGDDKQAQQEYLKRIRELPFVVESVNFSGTQFIDIQHVNNQVIIRLNTRHRFYREMWEPLRSIAERDAGTVSGDEAVRAARRTIEALSLLVIAYGKAESMDESPREHFGDLRMYWGQFLDSLMGKIKDVL